MLRRIFQITALCLLGALLAAFLSWVTSSRREFYEALVGGFPEASTTRMDESHRTVAPDNAADDSAHAVATGESESTPGVETSPLPAEASVSRSSRVPETPGFADTPNRVPQDREKPLGWCFFTTLNDEVVTDSGDVWSGSRSVLIREASPEAPSAWKVNALWQAVDGTPYRNARVQLTVHVKGRGGVFLFLEGASERELLLANGQLPASSSNKYFPSIGTGWTELDIVSEIKADADAVYFGIANNGSASLWVDDISVMDVGLDKAVTSTPSNNAPLSLRVSSGSALAQPVNLDFEQVSGEGASHDVLANKTC